MSFHYFFSHYLLYLVKQVFPSLLYPKEVKMKKASFFLVGLLALLLLITIPLPKVEHPQSSPHLQTYQTPDKKEIEKFANLFNLSNSDAIQHLTIHDFIEENKPPKKEKPSKKYKLKTLSTSTRLGEFLQSSTFPPIGGSLSFEKNLKSKATLSDGISASTLSTLLDFNVSKIYPITHTEALAITDNKTKTLDAHTKIKVYQFEIEKTSYLTGKKTLIEGEVERPVGLVIIVKNET